MSLLNYEQSNATNLLVGYIITKQIVSKKVYCVLCNQIPNCNNDIYV